MNSVFAPGLDEGVGNLWRVSSFCLFAFSATTLAWGGFADFACSVSRRERSWLLVIVLRRLLGDGGMINQSKAGEAGQEVHMVKAVEAIERRWLLLARLWNPGQMLT